MRSTQPCNHRLSDQLIDVTGLHTQSSTEFGRLNRRAKKLGPRQGRPSYVRGRRLSSLKLDPSAFGTPVSAALVLSPPILIVGSPIVSIDADARIWGIRVSRFGSPAVALIVANDGGRRRRRTKSQQPNGHQDRASKIFHRCLLEFLGRAVKPFRQLFGCRRGGSEPSGTHFILGGW